MLINHCAFPASSKEKRLCARVLAGCVFHELLPANRSLMNGFLLHLGRAYEITCNHSGRPTDSQVPIILHSLHHDLECDALRIDLAEHAYQAGETVGLAESTDLRIVGSQAVVSLDLEYWLPGASKQAADPRSEPRQRLTKDLLRVLLVTRRRWAKIHEQPSAAENGCDAVIQDLSPPVCPSAVVFWEDVLALVSRFAGPRPLISYLFGLLDF